MRVVFQQGDWRVEVHRSSSSKLSFSIAIVEDENEVEHEIHHLPNISNWENFS